MDDEDGDDDRQYARTGIKTNWINIRVSSRVQAPPPPLPRAAKNKIMPSYPLTVGGTKYDVDFPYEAYDCQLAMMEKVLESLTGHRNALLESPTGASPTHTHT